MVTLTNKQINDTYKDLLQVSNSNSGVDATLRDISDGEGTASGVKLSTTGLQISSGTTFNAVSGGIFNGSNFTYPTQTLEYNNVTFSSLTTSGIVSVDDTTDSTTTTTGSIHTDGGIGVAKTIVAGTGIKLGGTAAANLLADYEEGSWTPSLIFSAGSGTITYSELTGRYTKVGNMVTLYGRLTASSIASRTGDVSIGGIPFTADSDVPGNATVAVAGGLTITAGEVVSGRITSTVIILQLWDATTGTTLLQDTEVSDTTDFIFGATYRV